MGDDSILLIISGTVLLSSVRGLRRFIWLTFDWQNPMDPLGLNRPMISGSRRARILFKLWLWLSIIMGIAAVVRIANASTASIAFLIVSVAAALSYAGGWQLTKWLVRSGVGEDEQASLVAVVGFLLIPLTGWLLFRFTNGP